MIIGESNKCISGIFRMFEGLMFFMGISRRCFYGFLQSGKIPFFKVWRKLLGMFGDSLITDGRVIFALDDTLYGKTGIKIAGCDTHHDHASKMNCSKYIYGQCRVVLGILAFIHNRWACLPISNGLYRRKASIGKEQLENLLIYGRKRECEYSEFAAMHKGFMRQVKVVIIHNRNGNIFPIVSTDLSLSAKQMIEYYSARWKIESGFKELKHEFGAIDNQARKRESVENHFELCCLAQTIAWLYAMKQKEAPARKYASAKTLQYSFGDARRMIATEYNENGIFGGTCFKITKSVENIFLLLLLSRPA